MRCPFCEHPDTKVIDARNQRDAAVKRRRRECSECGRRFTTYERIEDLFPMVVKRDGRREVFDRLKIIHGVQKACQKRPVSVDAIEQAVTRIERSILDTADREIASTRIGDEVQAELRALDPVAWLRFMSVYLNFHTIEDFRSALDELEPEDSE
jgi:transcriptional repressor NrdR